jgi:hypothetical protein
LPDGKYVSVDAKSPASRRANTEALGVSFKDLFPLAYTLRVLIGREETFRTGLIQ